MFLFDTAIEDANVGSWLTRVQRTREENVGSGLEEIQVGLSCSSATMRLADEVASLHAAAVTRMLRPILQAETEPNGTISLTYLSNDGSVRSMKKVVRPLLRVPAQNDGRWSLHIAGDVRDAMFEQLRRAGPRETGGLLIGLINFKRKIAYVTRLLRAPRDSRGTGYAFRRGIRDLPEKIREIERRTGALLGYVGEWHTHPMGGSDLSDTDIEAVESLRSMLDPVSLPTLVTVVTPQGIHPHLFEPGSPRFEILRNRQHTIREVIWGLFSSRTRADHE